MKTGIGFLGRVYSCDEIGRIVGNWRYTLVMSPTKTAGNRAKKNTPWDYHGMSNIPGGWGGIRTPGGVAPTTVFKTVAIDRSATHPKLFYRRSLKPTVLFADRYPTVPAKRHERAYYTVLGAGCQFICWGKIITLANARVYGIIIPTERANIKGNKTWLNLFW